VGTLPRIVHPSVEKEVILRPPIFKDVDTLAKPLIEYTKASKWELSNAGMRRYGIGKTLIVMFMYATKTLYWTYEFQRRISADTALSNISLTTKFIYGPLVPEMGLPAKKRSTRFANKSHLLHFAGQLWKEDWFGYQNPSTRVDNWALTLGNV
jgi:hypothetical protein